MSRLKKVDHVTYACAQGGIERWAWFHIAVEGGVLINRIDDVRPEDPDSSMKIWCIDHGDFGIALVEGIDRRKKSQVTRFTERHGDHACQHVAYACHDLDLFRAHIESMGCHPRGETLVRDDGFGVLKQMFAKGYDSDCAGEAAFAEYVERPQGLTTDEVTVTFSQETGRGFYEQIEDAIERGDQQPLVDFTAMPSDWVVPEAAPHPAGRGAQPLEALIHPPRFGDLLHDRPVVS
ncbi:hypothetical protein ACFXDJ_04015 [Streptomyces sp. NPDC059443]|uniref:hypothetical protein n=1 Tax=unclassified Streptomyces TaxID=2593676 RepID=UPI0036784A99